MILTCAVFDMSGLLYAWKHENVASDEEIPKIIEKWCAHLAQDKNLMFEQELLDTAKNIGIFPIEDDIKITDFIKMEIVDALFETNKYEAHYLNDIYSVCFAIDYEPCSRIAYANNDEDNDDIDIDNDSDSDNDEVFFDWETDVVFTPFYNECA